MSFVELSVIILYFKEDLEVLLNCLGSVKKNIGDIDYEIILINNSGKNLDNLELKNQYPLKIINNPFNLGVAKSRNQGASLAGGRFLLFLDADIFAKNFAIKKLYDYIKKSPQTKIVGGKMILSDGSLQYSFGRLPNRLFFLYEVFCIKKRVKYQEAETCVDFLGGGTLCIEAEVFKKIGGFDENFSLYGWEDADFCNRAKKLNLKLIYLPESEFVHLLHKSSFEDLRQIDFYLSGLYYFKKNFGRLWTFFALNFLFFFSLFRFFILFFKPNSKKKRQNALILIKKLVNQKI